MRKKRLYVSAVGALVAGLLAVAMAAPASAAPSGLTVDPHHVRCGAQPIDAGPVTCPSATFTNNTTVNVGVRLIDFSGDTDPFGLFSGCNNVTLDPGQSCVVGFDFNPFETGHFSAKLTVQAFLAAFSDTASVRVSGRGTN
jgi:hypothetical protein